MPISRQAIPRILLVFLVLANLVFSAHLLRSRGSGFFAPHGDEVSRAAIGYAIRHGGGFPEGSIFLAWRLLPGPFPHKVWPPLQFYLIAGVYYLTGDLLFSPFLVNSLFASAILVVLYALLRRAAPRDPWLALGGAAVYAALPAIKAVDISGLDQTIVNFFILAGVFFWAKASEEELNSSLWAASVAFLFASATRFEGWFGAGIFECWVIWRFVFPLPSLPRRRLVAPLIIPLLFIALWSSWQFAHFGRLEYYAYHRSEALLGRDKIYLERSPVEKALVFPRLLAQASPAVAAFALAGLLLFRRLSPAARLAAAFAFAELLILEASVFSVGVPHGAPRLIATDLLLFLPVAVAGLEALLGLFAGGRGRVFAAPLCLVFAAASVLRAPAALRNGIPGEIFRIGRFLEASRANGTIGEERRVYVEYTGTVAERKWDTQAISLFVPACAVTSPPFSWKGAGERIAARIEDDRIALAVVWSEGARQRLPEFMRELFTAGPYTVYGEKVTKGCEKGY